MTLILIEHDATEPALYGAMAGVAARARGAAFAHLPARFDQATYADGLQHVVTVGELAATGLVWFERLSTLPVPPTSSPGELLGRLREQDVVVPHHPEAAVDEAMFRYLVEEAERAGIAVERLRVSDAAGLMRLHDASTGAPLEALGAWRRDRFGRLGPVQSAPRPAAGERPSVRIALVGTEQDFRLAYPATLAALGDAADMEGLAVEARFIPPRDLREQDMDGLLEDCDGVLLPGGSDMANVAGQIRVAHAALATATPAVGLCLGMQSMTTAVIQKALGSTQANLAEADPSAPIKTFVPLADEGTLPVHRLGERTIHVQAGSRLGDMLGSTATVRCNHRFRLNPDLLPVLERAGLRVAAHDGTRRIADAVELAGHPFYLGMQGHPEFASTPDTPPPLLRAFLRASRRAVAATLSIE
jgi:gamma-glutamyl-gamma-aminobutyrate hydrolase PuuD